MDEKKLLDLRKEMPYKWRVQSFSKTSKKATCIAYIDARDVMELLDEVVGAQNWKDEYKMVGDKMMAGVSIRIGDDWITKWDTGAESEIEKEKGEVSDAFKRAAVKWGVGRFLYGLKVQYVDSNEVKTNNNKPHVVDSAGKRVWDITEHINKSKNTPPPKTTTPPTQRFQKTQQTGEMPSEQKPQPTGKTIEVTYQGKSIQLDATSPRCPKCDATMWDNRENKASGKYKPTSADFSCSDKSCMNGEYRTSVWIFKEKKQEFIDVDVSVEDIPF